MPHFHSIALKRHVHHLRQMIIIQPTPRQLFKLRKATNHFDNFRAVILDTFPYWNRRCPIAIAAQIPIRRLLNNIMKPPRPQIIWRPMSLLVRLQHFLFLALDVHEPARMRSIHQLRATAVTMRIFVANIVNLQRSTFLQQCLGNLFIDLPDITTEPPALSIVAITIYQRQNWHIISTTQFIVILTVSWCNMNNSRTVIGRHKISMQHFMRIRTAVLK